MRVWIILSAILLFVNGCAHTRIKSQVNPDYFRGAQKSVSVLAVAKNDLEWKAEIERRVCAGLAQRGIVCQLGTRTVPPFRKWETRQQVLEQIRSRGGQLAVFVIRKKKYTEKESSTYATYDDEGNYSGTQSYTTRKRRQHFNLIVDDVVSGQRVLVATARTSGGGLTSGRTMAGSIAKSVIDELLSSGVLAVVQRDGEPGVVDDFLAKARGKTVSISRSGATDADILNMYFPGDGAVIKPLTISDGKSRCLAGPFSVEGPDKVCFYTANKSLPRNCWVVREVSGDFLFESVGDSENIGKQFRVADFREKKLVCH